MNTCLPTQCITTDTGQVSGWLSHAETNFIKVLNRVVADDAFVFTKVRVRDVLKNTHLPEQRIARDFGDRVFDFVLCDKNDLSVLCVVELDDRPQPLRKMSREKSYGEICRDAEIPLLEIPAMCGYDTERLKNRILPLINGKYENFQLINIG